MNKMQFVSMRDFRTQTTQIWNKLNDGEEIVITNNGRPRAFLVHIPDGSFDKMLMSIRQSTVKAIDVRRQREAVYEFIAKNNTTDDELSAEDYSELQSGKYKPTFSKKELSL